MSFHWLVYQSVPFLLFQPLWALLAHYSCIIVLTNFSITAPAYPHATGAAMYLALFSANITQSCTKHSVINCCCCGCPIFKWECLVKVLVGEVVQLNNSWNHHISIIELIIPHSYKKWGIIFFSNEKASISVNHLNNHKWEVCLVLIKGTFSNILDNFWYIWNNCNNNINTTYLWIKCWSQSLCVNCEFFKKYK